MRFSISPTICGPCPGAPGGTSGAGIRGAPPAALDRAPNPGPAPGPRSPPAGGALDDLVVDVGDVHHPRHPQAPVAKVPDEQVCEEERPEVPDMGRAVDRRPAAVDPHVPGFERIEWPDLARQRVVEPDRHA